MIFIKKLNAHIFVNPSLFLPYMKNSIDKMSIKTCVHYINLDLIVDSNLNNKYSSI